MSDDKRTFDDLEGREKMYRWVLEKLPSIFVEMTWDENTGTGFVISKVLWFAVRGVIFDEHGDIIVRKISEHSTLKGAQDAGRNWWAAGEQKMQQFKNADVIACCRVFFNHHAIYDKENDAVIEYYGSSSRKQKALVRFTPIKEFILREVSFGLRLSLFSTDTAIYKPQNIISLARSLVGMADYDLLGSNCQHLASFCTTGKAQSFDINLFQRSSSGSCARTGPSLALWAVESESSESLDQISS